MPLLLSGVYAGSGILPHLHPTPDWIFHEFTELEYNFSTARQMFVEKEYHIRQKLGGRGRNDLDANADKRYQLLN